jgi:integrase
VFCGQLLGGYQCGSALRHRYARALKRAGLRHLRFHDLRHTFGTRVIATADILRLQEWMGHADVQTTMLYLHSGGAIASVCVGGDQSSVGRPSVG